MTPPAAVEGLFGRDREVGVLRNAMSGICSGFGHVVAIEGDAGAGKTSLLGLALRLTDEAGLPASSVSCEPVVAPGALDAVSRLIGEAVPAKGDWLDAEWAVARLQALGEDEPRVVVVDDAQFADEASLRALGALARGIRTIPVLLVVAFRPPAPSNALDRLAQNLREVGDYLRLEPLSAEDVDRFVEHLAGDRLTDELVARAAVAEGNPFFIEAFVRAALLHAHYARDAHDRDELVLDGASALDAEAVNLLRIGSVLGSSFSIADVTALAGVQTAHVLPSVNAALKSGALVDEGQTLRFSQHLVRDAFYDNVPHAIRLGLHRDAAHVLQRRGAPAVDVATHLLLSEAADPAAMTTLREGVRNAGRDGSSVALDLIRRALDVCPPDHPERERLVVDVVEALAWAGHVDDARSLALREMDSVSSRVRAGLEAGLANVLVTRGRGAEAVAHLLNAQRLLGDDAAATLRIQAELGAAQLSAGNFENAARAAQVALAAPAQEIEARVLGHTTMAWIALMRAELNEAEREARQALRLADGADASVQRRVPGLTLGIALLERDDVEAAIAVLRASADAAAAAGASVTLPQHHWVLAMAHARVGAWDDAVAEATTGLEIAYDLDHSIGVAVAHTVIAEIALARGEISAADGAIAAAERAMLAASDWFGLDRLMWLKAVRAAPDDPTAALDHVRSAWSLGEALRIHLWRPQFALDLVQLELEVGDRHRAVAASDELRSIAVRSGAPSHRMLADLCAAVISDDVDFAARAADQLDQAGLVPASARAADMTAQISLRSGDTTAASTWFQHAYDRYAKLDAFGAMHAIDERLRRLGGSHAARADVVGLETLTDRERRVAALVAQGQSNVEIAEALGISRRTVENHLYRIFPKLGVASRLQLALYDGA